MFALTYAGKVIESFESLALAMECANELVSCCWEDYCYIDLADTATDEVIMTFWS